MSEQEVHDFSLKYEAAKLVNTGRRRGSAEPDDTDKQIAEMWKQSKGVSMKNFAKSLGISPSYVLGAISRVYKANNQN